MKFGKKFLALLMALCMLLATGIASAEVYTATAQGIGGDVAVSVTFEDGKIVSVEVGAHSETPGISDAAIEKIPAAIVAEQSLVVDAIGGATITSNAILTAAQTALTEAGVDVAPFMVKEETVLVEGETEETDVVIVGAGLAGLMAAYELKDNHPEVNYILIDKLDVVTGSLPTTGGAIIATTSKLHSADNNECTTQDIVDLFTYTSGTSVNEALVNNVYAESNVVLDRLVSWDCSFINPQVSSKYSDKVISYWHDGRGAGLVAAMNPYMAANPVNLRTATKAESLLVEDGKVVGVHVTDSEKAYDIRAKYVILATGGFGSSEEYMEKYLPLFADGFFSTNAGATGDGITMTAQFGTKVVGDGSMGSIVAPDGSALINVNFIVNNAGERFIGEAEPKYVVQRAVSQQDKKEAFLIADSSYADKETLAKKMEQGYVKEYNTLEELANDNGIDVAGLLATVEAYNAAADKGEDIPATEYALAASAAHKVVTAPYYVEKITLRTFGTIPGIEVNEFCQVLDGEGNPVPGLYGVGELIAGNAFTRQYPGAGVGISWAANTGRYVADELAESLK
ncbi:MAG: FAD-dependent oxidoreductase [bacterium]|nr:FAD-dependent oxidoreductase [bacterium]